MHIFKLLRTASPEANFLAIVSSSLLLLKILVFNRLPEIFIGAYQLGLIVEAILGSVVASYIFYIIVVHIKEQKDKAIVHPYIKKHAERVVVICQAQIREIGKASGINLELDTISRIDVEAAFKKITSNCPVPLLITLPSDADWFQYFFHYSKRTKSSIQRLLDQLPFLDAKLVSLLTAIDDCSHFNRLDMLSISKICYEDLSWMATKFYDYCELCKELNEHMESHVGRVRR
ncbi:MAG: hypothetical protein ACXWT0_14270 [Methylobacter sp.]